MASTNLAQQLAAKIRRARPGDRPFKETLRTSERVIRRVTDGIYREPWSALRELISNAYDADATTVEISTDAPRFKTITIHDNGNGFTADALASMCQNIGGSPKRTDRGAQLGVTAEEDSNLSPGGRRLIGKLGIGLFAVSQLTQQFRIITKVKGEKYRTVADVILFRNSEPRQRTTASTDELDTTGEIQITKLPAEDTNAHGTDVIIDALLPRTSDELRMTDLWELILHPPEDVDIDAVIRPQYHIGYTGSRTDDYDLQPKVPWDSADDPLTRFKKLTQAMFDRSGPSIGERRPSLKSTFDNYLRFVWLLALSAPIDYLEKHPFDITAEDELSVFKIGPMKGGRAEEVKLKKEQSIRDRLSLVAPERGAASEFVVVMDGLELRRPIRFTNLPTTSNKITRPLLFVGSEEADFAGRDERVTGGPLRFEAYLLWAPRIVPIEHTGALIRVGDASGSLFDETFLRYQTSEQTRKEQVSAEIFVHDGMDAAINIDRESFNYSHPHYQYISMWVHNAFKQFATKHKAIGQQVRQRSLATTQAKTRKRLDDLVAELVARWTDDEEDPIDVEFQDQDSLLLPTTRKQPALILPNSILHPAIPNRGTKAKVFEFDTDRSRITAVAQILYAAGLLDRMSAERRTRLLADLAAIIFFRGKE